MHPHSTTHSDLLLPQQLTTHIYTGDTAASHDNTLIPLPPLLIPLLTTDVKKNVQIKIKMLKQLFFNLTKIKNKTLKKVTDANNQAYSEYKHVLANILRSLFIVRMPPVEARSPDCRSNVENAPPRQTQTHRCA